MSHAEKVIKNVDGKRQAFLSVNQSKYAKVLNESLPSYTSSISYSKEEAYLTRKPDRCDKIVSMRTVTVTKMLEIVLEGQHRMR